MKVLVSEALEPVCLETPPESFLVSRKYSFFQRDQISSHDLRRILVDKLLETRMLDHTLWAVLCRKKLLNWKLSSFHQIKIRSKGFFIQSKHLVKIINLDLVAKLQTMFTRANHQFYLLFQNSIWNYFL